MRAIADGELETTQSFAEEMSYCLGCLACTTACPAGADYTDLLEQARAHVEQSRVVKTPRHGFVRWLTMKQFFMKPRLLRFAGRVLWLYQATALQTLVRTLRLTRLLPRSIRDAEPSTPTIRRNFSDGLIEALERPTSTPRYRVLLLTGCVQDLAFSDINRATADVLLANKCEVVTPRSQSCCGSLHAHNGELALARTLACRQLDAADLSQFDAIISNAGGCGSHLKRYDRLLAEEPAYASRAAEWSRKLRDISEWLVEIKFRHPQPPPTSTRAQLPARHAASAPSHPLSVLRSALTVERSPLPAAPVPPTPITYHEACHLCHGQGVSKQPRAILRAIPGLELRECSEATWSLRQCRHLLDHPAQNRVMAARAKTEKSTQHRRLARGRRQSWMHASPTSRRGALHASAPVRPSHRAPRPRVRRRGPRIVTATSAEIGANSDMRFEGLG
jgi:glycolate oxidase iron-sulfur subunit